MSYNIFVHASHVKTEVVDCAIFSEVEDGVFVEDSTEKREIFSADIYNDGSNVQLFPYSKDVYSTSISNSQGKELAEWVKSNPKSCSKFACTYCDGTGVVKSNPCPDCDGHGLY